MSASSTPEAMPPPATIGPDPPLHTPRINFVVAGVQKSGTRALQHFLGQHPEIGLVSKPKIAPHFFDIDSYFDETPDYSTFHSWFSPDSLTRTTGDITPIYTYWKPALARIHAYNPQIKIIVLLRNPVERAYSHWSMEFNRGLESDPFWKALLKEPFRRGLSGQHRVYSYLDRGFYYKQLRRLFAFFPREQCLIVKSEDLKQDHHRTLARIFAFLGVDPSIIPAPQSIHAGTYAPLSPILRRMLTLLFYRDIKRLEQLTKLDLGSWFSTT